MTKIALIAMILTASPLAPAAPIDGDLASARALQQQGSLPAARTAYQRALDTARAKRDDAGGAEALSGLAQVDLNLGRYSECLAEANEALSRFRAEGNKVEEGRILTTRGHARFYSGDSEAALRDFERGVEIARESGDHEGEITRLNNVGSVYYIRGRYGEALQRYQRALQLVDASPREAWASSRRKLTLANIAVLYQRVGQYDRALELYKGMGSSPEALPTREQAQMLGNMGTLYRRLGDPVKALETYRAAQALYHKSALLPGEVGVLINIGIAQTLDLSDPEAAARTFTDALRMAEKSGGKQLIMTSLLYRGEALLRADKLSRALADFEASSRLAADLNGTEEKWRAEYGLARVAERQGNLTRSNELLRDCVRIIEKMRKSSATPSGRSGFLIERREVYDLLIEHEAAGITPDVASIFQLMEQSRARDLQDRVRPQASSLEELRRRMPPDTLILEYWLGKHALGAIWISKARAGLLYRPLPESSVAALGDLPLALADSQRRDWSSLAQEVSVILLHGIDAVKQADLRRLIIVPDGPLARIPFEALPVETGTDSLVIDRFSVSYLPFAGAFRYIVERRAVFPPWKKTLVAFADPVPGTDGRGLYMATAQNQGLPEAATEVRSIGEAVGGRIDLHLGRDARKSYLDHELRGSVPLLHFATHAFADPEDPERSYILFAPTKGAAGFDYLFLKEAADLRAARVSLVTISACDSGSGRLTRGEGVQSFGSTFLAAGAQAVLTSLWRIGDRPAAELMTRFYRSLAGGDDAADALRQAKLAFRRSDTSAAHPAYWAAFVLTGDGDIRIPRVIGWKLLTAVSLAILGVLIAAAILFRRIKRTAGTV